MAIQFATPEKYDEIVSDGFVIVDFFSTTCMPCKMLSAVLEDLEAQFPFVNIVKVNITDYPELKERFDIRAVPTVYFYKDGEVKEENIGLLTEDELREIIGKYLY